MGAYWLGWNFLGALMFVLAGIVGLFPKHLPKTQNKAIENGNEGEKHDRKMEIEEKPEIKEDVQLKSM